MTFCSATVAPTLERVSSDVIKIVRTVFRKVYFRDLNVYSDHSGIAECVARKAEIRYRASMRQLSTFAGMHAYHFHTEVNVMISITALPKNVAFFTPNVMH
jgi:hypothetical protein